MINIRGIRFMIRQLLIMTSVVFLLTACSPSESKLEPELAPEPLMLITPEEAAEYDSQSFVPESEKGPKIEIVQPLLTSMVSSPLSIQVEFIGRQPDLGVNMGSFKLTYKKLWGIDITDRVLEYIDGESINAPEIELPEGKHTLEIYIEDNEENISTKLITFEVVKN